MSGDASVLVTLDGAVRDPGSPLLTGDDLAAVRGDGVFETLLIRGGAPCLVESHLRRLVSSITCTKRRTDLLAAQVHCSLLSTPHAKRRRHTKITRSTGRAPRRRATARTSGKAMLLLTA